MKRGTTLLRCEPFCHIVSEERRASVCDNCFFEAADDAEEENALKKCTQCKVARYCGVRCQVRSVGGASRYDVRMGGGEGGHEKQML